MGPFSLQGMADSADSAENARNAKNPATLEFNQELLRTVAV